MDKVQFIGVNELDTGAQMDVRHLINEFLPKFQKIVPNFEALVVHLKQYDKGGKPKFSFHIRFIAPGIMKEAHADEFVLTKALHAVLDMIQRQLTHEH